MTQQNDGDVSRDVDEPAGDLLREQRDVNQQLLLASLRAQESADAAASEANVARAKEDALRILADTMPTLAWYAAPDGSFLWYNLRWYDYTNATFAELEGWKWQSVLDPDDLPRIVAKWKAALASGEPWEDQFRLRGHDGEFRWFLSRAVPLRDPGGQIVRWFGTNVDINDQRRAAEDRARLLASEREARREAEAANRLKDEFLATMGHELRTPLNAILGWSTLLRRGPYDVATADRALATIERNARAQARLIDDILDVSRIISGNLRMELRRVDMNAIARAAVDVVRPAADAKRVGLSFDVTPADAVAPMIGDGDRLQQIVWNLLNNAVKFTPVGGKVSLLVERVGSTQRVTVRDTGIGISAEHLPCIFERFRQVDGSTTRRHGGLGLGLAIVEHLAKLHDGSVTAESAGVGLGATFTVTLPIRALIDPSDEGNTESRGGLRPSPLPSHSPTTLAGLNVLVVDNDEDSRFLLRTALERVGGSVHVVDSAGAAMAYMENHFIDVIISDIGMPDEDGYQFMQRVRALPANRGGQVAALALTAYARGEDVRRAYQAGYQTHLAKPADVNELTSEVARLAAAH